MQLLRKNIFQRIQVNKDAFFRENGYEATDIILTKEELKEIISFGGLRTELLEKDIYWEYLGMTIHMERYGQKPTLKDVMFQ